MKVRSSITPQPIQVTKDSVLVASNVAPFHEEVDGHVMEGYEYDCTIYTKDQYLILQNQQITSLQEELVAAKILLGVD